MAKNVLPVVTQDVARIAAAEAYEDIERLYAQLEDTNPELAGVLKVLVDHLPHPFNWKAYQAVAVAYDMLLAQAKVDAELSNFASISPADFGA